MVPSGDLYKKMNFENLDLLAGNEVPNVGSKVRVSWERTDPSPPVLGDGSPRKVVPSGDLYKDLNFENLDLLAGNERARLPRSSGEFPGKSDRSGY